MIPPKTIDEFNLFPKMNLPVGTLKEHLQIPSFLGKSVVMAPAIPCASLCMLVTQSAPP